MKQNHKHVLVVVDPQDYAGLLEYLQGNQDDQLFRRKLAWKAFQYSASYDSAVSEWMWKQTEGGTSLDHIFLATVNKVFVNCKELNNPFLFLGNIFFNMGQNLAPGHSDA